MPDWLTALDDALTDRFRRCLLCPAPAHCMQVRVLAGAVWYVVLCARCNTAEGWDAVDQLLQQR